MRLPKSKPASLLPCGRKLPPLRSVVCPRRGEILSPSVTLLLLHLLHSSSLPRPKVKVCDICGDAGREDLLAVCSKCSDGAEHTYCMSEMLHKVPEGDWLCEECKIKEMNNQNVDRCEAVSERLSSTCLNESSKNALSSSIPKMSPKLDSGPTDLVTPGPSKPPQSSHILTRRQADLPEEGKASERNVSSIETASPRKKSILSRQFSLKSQIMENVKTTSIPTLPEVHPVKGSEAFSRSKASLSSTSFKGQPQPHSPHGGPLSRSVSFSYSNNVPKVKTLIENASHKQNIAKASMASDLRKDGLVKSLARTTSFNNTTSGRPNTDLLTKSSSFKPSLIEGLRGPKEVKERNTVERKNISAMQNSFVRPSSVVSSSNHPIKVDAKYVHSDGKIKGVSETDVARSSRGFNDANDLGVNEGKKQTSCSSKMVGFSEGNSKAEHLKKSKLLNKDVQTSTCAIDGSKRKVEIVSPHSVQSSDSGRKDESMRDSSSSTSSRLSSQGGSQKSRCQKCNETGHAAQHCSVDKLQKSTNKLSAEGISNEVVKKHNKWREIVDAAISRSGVLKGNKPDACGELLASKVDANCEAASKFAPSDFIQRNSVSVVESGNGKGVSKHSNVDSTKNSTVTNSGPPAVVPVEVSHVSKADDTTGKFSEKPFSETLQELSPLAASTLKASAVPKLECIWHGSFNVVGSGKCPEMFEGIQAHLSSCASQRVFEAAMKVPYSVHLEEVSHISLWPSHFQKIGAQEENIGLFFFAEDSESYERSYRKLMDRMHKNDLALRGNIDGIELLIFRSNKLPMKSQRWNMMYYLWGMFRARRGYGLPAMGGQKKASIANLDVEIPKQDSSIPPITDFRKAQNSENSSILNKLSDEWRPSKMMRREQDDSVHMFPVVSGIEHKTCRRLEASVENSLTQVVADPNVARRQPSFPVGNSSGTISDPQRVADSSKFALLMPASKSCSEGKNDERLQKKIVTDCTNRKTGDLGEESNIISAYNQAGDEFSRIEGNLRDKECSTSSVAIIDDDDPRQNALMADCLNNRKRGRSCSIETHGMPSNTTEVGQLREGQSWMSIDDERERKKICYASDSSGTEANASTRLSSKIHPLHSTILSEQTEGEGDRIYGATPESSKITERCFFPTDLIPVQNNRSADIIHIPSSDDEETAKSCTPDLELALGGKNKSAAPPFPFAPFGGRKHLKAGSLGDEGDDLSASLSLSIGFPAAERERSAKNFFKKEQVSPEKPSADTSLFLFGRFSNS